MIAMELAGGGTLKDLVTADGPLRPARAVDVMLQVIAGLEAAAAAGVLHRDIKPSNCFVDAEGRIKSEISASRRQRRSARGHAHPHRWPPGHADVCLARAAPG